MRLTILGGGGFRVPLIYAALAAAGERGTRGGADRVVLHDIDPARVAAVRAVLDDGHGGAGPKVHVEPDLAAALRGADFVFSAIRVGGLRGRTVDERAALAEGLLGQETTGAGGVCYGLRTVPAALRIAEAVRAHAPGAWVINFTNPAGLVTEAMSHVLGDRVIGVCDSPVGLFRRVAGALGVDPERAWFDYAGLNHLGWLRRVLVGGRDLLPGLLADEAALGSFEEGTLFGPAWLRTLGAIPNEYLYYYYFTQEAVAAVSRAPATRGEFLQRQQEDFYRAAAAPGAARRWEAVRLEREATYMADVAGDRTAAGHAAAGPRPDGGGYDAVALALMRAIAADERATLVLNVRNRSALPGLDADAVVEVPCVVGSNGAHPLATAALAPHAAALAAAVKAADRATIHAATTGSRRAAVKALAIHPLVDSVHAAERILARELDALPELRAVLVSD